MKPTFVENNYKNTSDSENDIGFTVVSDPFMMKRLSDDIYMRPIEAIIRETSTNAFDAQVENGNPERPFDVHIPTQSEPYYSIRDYGTGLSKKGLTEVFTTYGKSTRRESDDFIGSIGIGSKSPFAYASQFQVTTRHNGTKIVALCYKDENHVPKMKVLSEEPTSEESGVTVEFPVETKDVYDFTRNASAVYYWFDVKPNVNIELDKVNDPNEERNILLEEDGEWLISKTSSSYNPYIIMGNVCYESPITCTIPGLFCRVDVGDVAINANRESIQDNHTNKEKLRSIIEKAQKQIQTKIQDKLDGFSRRYKAATFLSQIQSKLRLRTGHNTFTFKDQPLSKDFALPQGTTMHYVAVGTNEQSRCWSTMPLYNLSEYTVIYADIKTGFVKAAKEYLKNNKQYRAILIKGDLQQFLDATDYPEQSVILASKHYKKAAVGNRVVVRDAQFLFDQNRNGITNTKASRHWTRQKIDPTTHNKTILVTEVNNYKPIESNVSLDIILRNVDHNTYDVVGLKPKQYQEWKKYGLTNIRDHLNNKSLSGEARKFIQTETYQLVTTGYSYGYYQAITPEVKSGTIDGSGNVYDLICLLKNKSDVFMSDAEKHKLKDWNHSLSWGRKQALGKEMSFWKANEVRAAEKEVYDFLLKYTKKIENDIRWQYLLRPISILERPSLILDHPELQCQK